MHRNAEELFARTRSGKAKNAAVLLVQTWRAYTCTPTEPCVVMPHPSVTCKPCWNPTDIRIIKHLLDVFRSQTKRLCDRLVHRKRCKKRVSSPSLVPMDKMILEKELVSKNTF